MPELTRYEAERAAWINSKTWLDKPGAARRASILTRRARELERKKAGLDGAPGREAEIRGVFHLWTHHDDTKTSALGLIAYVIVYVITLPIAFGIAWLVSVVVFKAVDLAAEKRRPRVWHAVALAVASCALFAMRPLGWDLWAIHAVAWVLETGTGGFLAPRALSGWYAAGWLSWGYVQVVIGLLRVAWLTYSWGWEAPAVRKVAAAEGRTHDEGVRIIQGSAATSTRATTTSAPQSAAPEADDTEDEEAIDMAVFIALPEDIDIESHESETSK